jgi:intracellular multiplication protein IcmP
MPKPQGQDRPDDQELVWAIGAGLIIAVIWLIWTFARNVIVWFSFGLDLAQMHLLDLALPFNETATSYMRFMEAHFQPSMKEQADPFKVSFAELKLMSEAAGTYFRWIFAPLIFWMAIWVMMKMKGAGLARGFSLAGGFGPSLAAYQAQHWKVLTPGSMFDPNKLEKSELPAQTPMEWMHANKVDLSDEIDGLDIDAATAAFEKQLGERWEGMEKAPTYIKALCVAIYTTAKRDKNARQIKEQIAVTYATKKPAEIEKIILELYAETKKDEKFAKLIDKYASKHAYTNTAMYRLLTWSRANGGVFASAEVRWLKPVDRTLWYVLNNCGRRSFHIEGAGGVSHFHSENIIRGPLVEPHVDQAVEGLEDYLEHQGITDLKAFMNGQSKDF